MDFSTIQAKITPNDRSRVFWERFKLGNFNERDVSNG